MAQANHPSDTKTKFVKETIDQISKMHFSNEKTKYTADALIMTTEMMRIYVLEAATRAATQAKSEGNKTVELELPRGEPQHEVLQTVMKSGPGFGFRSWPQCVMDLSPWVFSASSRGLGMELVVTPRLEFVCQSQVNDYAKCINKM